METEFDWIVDIPGDQFTKETYDDLFEYAQEGDEVYVHGRVGHGWYAETIDNFGVIVYATDDEICVQFDGTMNRESPVSYTIPRQYEAIPELWIQEQGFATDNIRFEVEGGVVYIPDCKIFRKRVGAIGSDIHKGFMFHLIRRD
jgi:hypothetical protein